MILKIRYPAEKEQRQSWIPCSGTETSMQMALGFSDLRMLV